MTPSSEFREIHRRYHRLVWWLAAGKSALVSVGWAAATLGVIGTVGRAGRGREPSRAMPAATSHEATESSPSTPVATDPSSPPSLDEDVALLQRAAQQIDHNHPAEALATLEQHARAHPDSALAPERLGLRVRALCVTGAIEEARTIAARHVAEHPGTRLAATLATPCEEPVGPERGRSQDP